MEKQSTTDPVQANRHTTAPTIEFLRLPRPGATCPVTGLKRTMLNSLILPSPENHNNPPVKSVSLRQPGNIRGVRLIDFASLMKYLRSHQQNAE